MSSERVSFTPIDARPPAQVRALILTRSSSPSASDAEVESQIDQAARFITAMGWTLTHPENLAAYTERKTGMRQVRRPVLDAVLALAQRGEVDVIVVTTPSRIARTPGRRYAAIQTALDYGCEFRFSRYAADAGRYPGGVAGLLEQLKDDLLDGEEAKTIHDRLTPGRLRRYELGLPQGGRTGPAYGWTEGERATTRPDGRGRPKGLLNWRIDETQAVWVRWLFAQVDARPIVDLSLRGLTRDLAAHATPASGTGRWTTRQVERMLRDPKYCGRGSVRRTCVRWEMTREVSSGRVYEEQRIVPRPATEWFPLASDAVPALIEVDLFDRVQAKLDAYKAQASQQHGGARSAHSVLHETLLAGGLVFCAHCDGRMFAFYETRQRTPYYRCLRRATAPTHSCQTHSIRASATDALTLRLLAFALTDPEQILALADAAQTQEAAAATDAALAERELHHAHERLAHLGAEREKLTAALASLGALDGMDSAVTDLRARLARLDSEAQELTTLAAQATPRRDRASERQAFLRRLFTSRDWLFSFAEDARETNGPTGTTTLRVPRTLDIGQAAALLDVPEEDVGLYTPTVTLRDEDDDELTGARTADVVFALLQRLPRERLRALLFDMDARVLVSRTGSRAERGGGRASRPAEERVTLRLLGEVDVRLEVGQPARTPALKLSSLAYFASGMLPDPDRTDRCAPQYSHSMDCET